MLASPQSSYFEFALKIADYGDVARVFIDGDLIAQTGPGKDSGTGSKHLVRGGLYSISIEYYESTGLAAILLEWSHPEISKQPIPAYYLHPHGDSLQHSPFPFQVTR